MAKNVVGMKELFQLFEDDITLADINASKYLGKVSGAIVKRRIELRMTQKEFADYVGVSQGMVSRWEGGDYNFTVRALAELAEKLDLELYINLKRYRDNVTLSYLEDADFLCSSSEKTQFVERSSKILNFCSKASVIHDRKKYVNKVYNIKESLEM